MKKRILVVDDEVALTRMMKLNIESTGLYEVRTVNKGSEALEAAKEFAPDLIFLDVMMPDMGGDEVAAGLQEDQQTRHIKFIFLTAIVTQEDTGGGASDISGHTFLAKPVQKQELLATIEEFVS